MIYVITAHAGSAAPDDRAIGDWIRGNLDSWVEPVPGTWIVEGALAAEQIENALAPLLAAGDRLLIVKAGTEAVWRGVPAEAARWLTANFPGSITNRIPGEGEFAEHG